MALDAAMLADSWLGRHDHEIVAVASVALAVILAVVVDRGFARRGRRLAVAVARGGLSPVADTRLRFLRRLALAVILAFGLFVALGQFGGLHRVVNSVLASGALAAAVIGFAARQTLANAVAGVMLAITQPLRIGDVVCVEGETGTVEDVRLNYSVLRTGGGSRLFIPNERLAGGVLRNDTIVDESVVCTAEFWVPAGSPSEDALGALARALPGAALSVAEIGPDSVRYVASANALPAPERAGRESEMRRAGLRELHAAGLLGQEG
jgi:small-conductance mechanosensitive channel